mmetsp:Transcript_88713/g.259287  ORF Transcript_88713/g.259287 Transcript_88713/m.259287 type:complete len:204 (-) Transcript_88713:186-797(-)
MGANCCHGQNAASVGEIPEHEVYTTAHFVEELARHSGKDQDVGGKHVKVNVELIETILLQDREGSTGGTGDMKRSSDRKGTGFVLKMDVEDAVNSVVRLSLPPAEVTTSGEGRVSRVKDRKGTGYVSKEKLLHMLENVSDDEEEELRTPSSKETEKAATGDLTLPVSSKTVKERCEARKGTGFVTKAKLKKVLVAVGEDEDDD